MPDIDRDSLIAPLTETVRAAGQLALAASRQPVRHWVKDGHSPVSEVDLAVDALLAERLPALAPGAGWLSEETEDNAARLDHDFVWVVDPIDGTRAFIEGKPDWSVSVALVAHGRPVLAALYVPVTEEFFLAAADAGATRNGARLRANAGGDLTGARFAGPRSHLDRLRNFAPGLHAEPKIHSLALRLARVAEGRIDAALASRNSHDWDLAAADLLVHEAGGVMTGIAGEPLRYNRPETVHGTLLAAGLERHEAIVALVRDRGIALA